LKDTKVQSGWRHKLHEIIYEADTPAGKFFDLALFVLIIFSVLLVMLESVASIDTEYHDLLFAFEWGITIFFTFEYFARIISIKKPFKYIFSFYGIIDFISTIPLYLSYIFVGSQVLLAVRALRLLRVFRILKLVKFLGEASQLKAALKASRDETGFTSIPRSIYWTIVTLTTVGYGDIAPQTNLGQFLATIIMVLGYGIIAVPTGIVTVEFSKSGKNNKKNSTIVHTNTQACPSCSAEEHRDNAKHCYNCGDTL